MNRTFLRLLGIIIFILIVWGVYSFATGPVKQPAVTETTSSAMFYCAENTTIKADFSTDTVALTLSDGRTFTLPHALSASGARYEATSTGVDIVFWNKGDNAFITENGVTTYSNCTAANVVASDAPGYNVYTDQSGLFSFAFPTNFEVAGVVSGYSEAWSSNATTSGTMLAQIHVPQSYEPGTNFGDANFTVGVSGDPSAIAGCLTNSNSQATAAQVTMNGLPFTKLTSSDAAAGNRYETTAYHIVRDNQCYAIEYTVHYGVLENYPEGTVEAFDSEKITGALDEMAQSFQFLQ